MKHIITFTVLFIAISTKGFAQITMPNQNNVNMATKNKYAVIEIGKFGIAGAESTILFYSGGAIEDLTDLLYSPTNNKYLPDLKTNYGTNQSISEPLKALVCIQYMAEKNYVLVSSNATRCDGVYSYQYVFQKKEN